MIPTIQRLFVYGTLAPGRPNEHVLEDVPGEWEPATVRGELVQQGWGADAGFPGIVLDEHGPEVEGLVLSSAELDRHWKRLDDFEGEEYERVLAPTRLRSGETVEANVYTLRRASGDR